MVVVVMRVTTLKASADKLPGLLAYYAGLAEDRERPGRRPGSGRLLPGPGRAAGRWWGGGRAALGLDGTVTGDDLRAVLEARHPATGAAVGSAVRGLVGAGVRRDVLGPEVGVGAVGADAGSRGCGPRSSPPTTPRSTPRWAGSSARGGDPSGSRRRVPGRHLGVTAAVFRQHTSRTVDPQLHSHAIVAAKVQDPTGRWLSLDARFLKYQQRSIGCRSTTPRCAPS